MGSGSTARTVVPIAAAVVGGAGGFLVGGPVGAGLGASAGYALGSGIEGSVNAPKAPMKPGMPASPIQAQSPIPNAYGDIAAQQKMARTLGGTMFQTPTEWWGQQQNKMGSAGASSTPGGWYGGTPVMGAPNVQGKTLLGT